MPASRWNSNLLDEILAWIDEDELSIADLILNPIVTRVVDVEEDRDYPEGDTEIIRWCHSLQNFPFCRSGDWLFIPKLLCPSRLGNLAPFVWSMMLSLKILV